MIKKYITLGLLLLSGNIFINARSTNVSSDQMDKKQQDDIQQKNQRDKAKKAANNEYQASLGQKSSITSDEALAQFTKTGDASHLDLSYNQSLGDIIQSLKAQNIKPNFAGATLVYANLTPSDGSSNDLSGVDFSLSTAQGINLIGCNLQGANFNNAHIEQSYLIGANINAANFQHAVLSGAVVSYVTAHGTNFNYANLTGADVTSTDFQNAIFNNSNISGVDFTSTNFKGAQFQGTKVVSANHLGFTGGA